MMTEEMIIASITKKYLEAEDEKLKVERERDRLYQETLELKEYLDQIKLALGITTPCHPGNFASYIKEIKNILPKHE